jgi:hypothetical protein
MSGETEKAVSGWTVDTLHGHLVGMIDAVDVRLNQRVTDLKELIGQSQAAAKEAQRLAENIDTYNKAQANEWRHSLDDLRQTFVTKAVGDRIEADTKRVELTLKDTVKREDLHKIEADIEKLRDVTSSNNGKSENAGDWLKTLLTVASIAVAIIFGALAYSAHSTSGIGIDSKRVDDLINRMDGQARRLDSLDSKLGKQP